MAKRSRSSSSSIDPFDRRYMAEFVGTLILVLVGCGSIAITGLSGNAGGALSIGLAFGVTLTALIYSIGVISGGHFNPAVSVAMAVAGRMKNEDLPGYIICQVLGGIVGAGILVLILWIKTPNLALSSLNLGQNNFGPGFLGAYPMWAALLVEFVATLVLALVVLAATAGRASLLAGLVIGLTLVGLHLAFITVTGLSVNPARSFGPAAWLWQTPAMINVWVFIVAPIAGGAVAGWLHKEKVF